MQQRPICRRVNLSRLRSHLEDLSQLRFELNPAWNRSSRFFARAVAKLWTGGSLFHSRYSSSAACTELLCIGKSPTLARPAGKGEGWCFCVSWSQASGLYPNPISTRAEGCRLAFHEWMGQGSAGDGLDFSSSSIRIWLALVEPTKRIVVGADVLRHPELPSNGAAEHPAECTNGR
jgi:hypothetical protein